MPLSRLPTPLTSTQMFTRLVELEKENAELKELVVSKQTVISGLLRILEQLQWRRLRLEAELRGR